MFGQFYGNYLIRKSLITNAQFDELMEFQKTVRVKLGLIAVAEKLLTVEQADELNRLQATMDKRFGDIAVEKGYLTEDHVKHLLSLQGNPYLSFVQAIIEKGFMNLEEVETNLLSYQKENNFTDEDLIALKNNDIDKIISIFVRIDSPLYNDLISLAIRNVIRLINSEIYLDYTYSVKSYEFDALATQSLQGNHKLLLGFAGKENSLLSIASPFAKEEFDSMNEDSFDSVCEFLNCINGLFASKLSQEHIDIDMLPPMFYTDRTITATDCIYVVPIYISGTRVDLLISIDNELNFSIE